MAATSVQDQYNQQAALVAQALQTLNDSLAALAKDQAVVVADNIAVQKAKSNFVTQKAALDAISDPVSTQVQS